MYKGGDSYHWTVAQMCAKVGINNCCNGRCSGGKIYKTPACGGSGGYWGWWTACAPIPVPIVIVRANGSDGPIVITPGSDVSIWWRSRNSTSCAASGGWFGSKAINGDYTEVVPNVTTDANFNLSCTGPGGSRSDSVQVIANELPIISISSADVTDSPQGDGITYTQGDDVDVIAEARDPDGSITQVKLFNADTSALIGAMAPNGNPLQYSLVLNDLPAGTLTVFARATDNDGSTSDSAPFIIDVQALYDIWGDAVYLDDAGAAVLQGTPPRYFLTIPPASPVQPGAGTTIDIPSLGKSTPVLADGTFSALRAVAGTYLVNLNIGDQAIYFCGRPSSCSYSITVGPADGDETNLRYYVASTRDPWFQVVGGDVHTNATGLDVNSPALANPVPFSCEFDPEGLCQSYPLLLQDADTNTVGIITHASGTIDISDQDGNQTSPISQGDISKEANSYLTPFQDYAYIYALYEFPLNPTSDFGGILNGRPASLNAGNRGANDNLSYFRQGDLTLSASNWTGANRVANGERIIIFVAGNLTIQVPIEVEPGGFLAFIVSGNIAFDPNLGNPVDPVGSTNPNENNTTIEGIYVADGIISTGTFGADDLKFVAEGSFIGWTGIDLERNYDDPRNNIKPAEVFIFRPDFLINAPDEFKRSIFFWQEVAP